MKETNYQELYEKVSEQAFRWRHAQSNGMMVNQETERLKNIALNNMDDIVAALKYAVEAAETIRMLETEVDSADAELKELDDEIKKLRSEKTPAKARTKPKEAADVE